MLHKDPRLIIHIKYTSFIKWILDYAMLVVLDPQKTNILT